MALLALADWGIVVADAFAVALRGAWLLVVATDSAAVAEAATAIVDAGDVTNEGSAFEAARAYERSEIVSAILQARLARADGAQQRHDAVRALAEHLLAIGHATQAFDLCVEADDAEMAYAIAVRAPLPHRLLDVVMMSLHAPRSLRFRTAGGMRRKRVCWRAMMSLHSVCGLSSPNTTQPHHANSPRDLPSVSRHRWRMRRTLSRCAAHNARPRAP